MHLDGLEKTHDLCVEREGVFREAVEGIRAAKAAGFMVCTNTTVYKETDMREIEALFEYLEQFDVDGHQLSPAYGYSAVNDREIFMTREDIREKFKDVDRMFKRFRLNQTPMYLEFLQGTRELPCTAWGNPTYNVAGWKGPCYLITDGHYKTFEEFMTRTPWESYGPGNDPRCEHCMTHCGFEPSAALGINARLADSLKLLTWMLGDVTASQPPQLNVRLMKPTLVTGASGFLGWHVARLLAERGHRVRALVRPGSKLRELEAEPCLGDLRDRGVARARRRRVRAGVPRGGGLPAVGAGPGRDVPVERGWHAQRAGGRAEGGRGARGLHEHGGVHRRAARGHRRRGDGGVARGHDGRL